MATNDGYNPYPLGVTAKAAVQGIKNGIALPQILARYPIITQTETPPTYEDVATLGEFWYNTASGKLYRASVNTNDKIVLWFEV